MKLMRVGEKGNERPALMEGEDGLRDICTSLVPDITGEILSEAGLARLKSADISNLPRISGHPRIGVPIANIGKVVGVGLNYYDHAEAAGKLKPEEPILFLKPNNTLVGPNDTVRKPKTAKEAGLGM